MRKNYYLFAFVSILLLGVSGVWAQSYDQNTTGYIIKVDGEKIYLNMPNIKVSDVVSVLNNGGYTTDPRTGQDIWQDPQVVGQIKIIAVQGAFSVGWVNGTPSVFPREGMTVRKETIHPSNNYRSTVYTGSEMIARQETVTPQYDYGKTTVMVGPADLNFPAGYNTMVGDGYIGDIVATTLMSHLLRSDKIQLVDRSIFGAYQNNQYGLQNGIYEKEMELYKSGAINPNTMIQYGQMSGVRFLVKITMQKPDIVNVSNSVPIRGLANLVADATNSRRASGTQYLPDNVSTSNIKVAVNIVIHVIDLQTGGVMFMTNSIGTAKGKPQIGFESYEYGRGSFNNKDVDFMQTVTGKAVDDAFRKIGPQLNKYFHDNL